jgi:hypothetical protein
LCGFCADRLSQEPGSYKREDRRSRLGPKGRGPNVPCVTQRRDHSLVCRARPSWRIAQTGSLAASRAARQPGPPSGPLPVWLGVAGPRVRGLQGREQPVAIDSRARWDPLSHGGRKSRLGRGCLRGPSSQQQRNPGGRAAKKETGRVRGAPFPRAPHLAWRCSRGRVFHGAPFWAGAPCLGVVPASPHISRVTLRL